MCLSLPYISIQTTFPFEVLNLTLMSLLFSLTLYICSKATFSLEQGRKKYEFNKVIKIQCKMVLALCVSFSIHLPVNIVHVDIYSLFSEIVIASGHIV
jgi:hypothetical protein